MTEANQDALSAAIDGELSREELRFLLRRLDHDAALAERWSRFHLAGDVLRGQVPAQLASAGFADRVMAAIDAAGVAPAAVGVGRRRHWLHWSAGGAIAAGVAVAALMVAQPAGRPGDSPAVATAPGTAVSGNLNDTVEVASAPAAAPQWLTSSNASQFSQQAAFGSTPREVSYPPQPMEYSVQPVQVTHGQSANDGRYMILRASAGAADNGGQPAARRAQAR
jgi:sigma-E factor negative regulatory protein RseA